MSKDENILSVRNIFKEFKQSNHFRRVYTHALRNVSFNLSKGHTLGIVGESGCGKSTLAKVIMGLVKPTSGQVEFKGRDIFSSTPSQLRILRNNMQMVFQDPYASLNPRWTIKKIISEPLKLNTELTKYEIQQQVFQLLETVGLSPNYINKLATECSGGQRQRIGIARAIALNPDLIICDEPVSALDISIQSQILNLLKYLQYEQNLSYIFISHDISVIRHISDTICIMYLGEIIEKAENKSIFQNPIHPYTKLLLRSVPKIFNAEGIPSLSFNKELTLDLKEQGCIFIPRCPICTSECYDEGPTLKEVSPNHWVSCYHA